MHLGSEEEITLLEFEEAEEGNPQESQHRSSYIMKHDGSDEYGITIPAMVTIVCF